MKKIAMITAIAVALLLNVVAVSPAFACCGSSHSTNNNTPASNSTSVTNVSNSSSSSSNSTSVNSSNTNSNSTSVVVNSSSNDDEDEDDEDLTVVCRAEDSSVEEGDEIEWIATVSGGDGDYDYEWSGTDGLDGDDRTVSMTYDDHGTKNAYVVVESDGQTDSASCSAYVSEEDEDEDEDEDFDVVCRVSDTRVEEGDRVTFEVEIDGGNSPFEINWSSDDLSSSEENDLDDEDEWSIRLDDEGNFEVSVTVEDDDGNRESDDCSVVRVSDEDEDDDDDVTVISSVPTGYPSSGISSVYLSQVPYTGSGDVLAFIGLLLAALTGAGYIVYRSVKKHSGAARASVIENFKRSNIEAKG